MVTSSSNLKQIAIGYANFSNAGTRTRVIQASGSARYVAASPKDWAEVVAKYGDLNDAGLYFISTDPKVTALATVPKIVLDSANYLLLTGAAAEKRNQLRNGCQASTPTHRLYHATHLDPRFCHRWLAGRC